MSIKEPLIPSPRPVGVDILDLEDQQPPVDEAWLACPYTDAEIDAIFDAWKR